MLNETDLNGVDLNLLVVFEAVFRERHVANAARKLHVSPSAVSHGLGRLRELFDDPLFLRTPKGVLPTTRASALSLPVFEILSRVRGVVGSVAPFEPARSARRFVVGSPDAIAAVVLPRLMSLLRRDAPNIDLSFRHLLPQTVIAELEAGTIDLALTPFDDSVPARFVAERIFDEEFVVAARLGHPFLESPSLRRYCDALHVLVSISGDNSGYMDAVLAERGLSRRVALSVPNFMLALAALPGTDLLAAVPSSLISVHGTRFKVGSVKAPLPNGHSPVGAVVSKAALMDPGVAWLKSVLERAAAEALGERAGGPQSRAPARIDLASASPRARRRGPRGGRK